MINNVTTEQLEIMRKIILHRYQFKELKVAASVVQHPYRYA